MRNDPVGMRRFDRFAHATLSVSDAGGHRISVVGAVAKPGVYALRPDVRVADVSYTTDDFQYRTPIKFGGVALDKATVLITGANRGIGRNPTPLPDLGTQLLNLPFAYAGTAILLAVASNTNSTLSSAPAASINSCLAEN